ncbi:MAG: serine hydrolase domain-containing protein [Chitinophagales bacterium]
MKTWQKIGLILLLILVIAGAWLYPKYEMLNRTIHLFDEDKIVENFRSVDETWPVGRMKASTQPHTYPKGTAMTLPQSFTFKDTTFNSQQYLKDSWTTGFLVIQNDSIVFEDYYLGNSESTQTISWSMAKSFISALMGIAIEEGHISGIAANVEDYVPKLKGTAYEGVKIKDVLQMSTGVRFNEDYGDFNSDINRWGRGFALGDSQDAFAATLERELEPGTVNHYVSINTHVLGMILTQATGRTITDYMHEKLYEPLGMEYEGYWLLDGYDMEMALGGLNLTLRDFAKIGSLYLKNGAWKGKQIVPNDWTRASVTPDAPHLQPQEGSFGYGYQWWIPKSDVGEFMAIGVYNQNIYVNPTTNTVIVKLSANPHFNDMSYLPSSDHVSIELYRAIAALFEVEEVEAVE